MCVHKDFLFFVNLKIYYDRSVRSAVLLLLLTAVLTCGTLLDLLGRYRSLMTGIGMFIGG